jgi:phosphoribosylformimino-5-aminoimidazole carboxamide ribotide isomerase
MIIFPALDLRHGKCVRLLQGRATQETVYSEDPVAVARMWEAEGARWLHLVDLDGAMSSGTENRALAKRIIRVLGIPVQFGGGIRTMADFHEILEAGAGRVILGTAAIENSELLSEALTLCRERVVVGLDAKEGWVVTRGWNQVERLDALAFAQALVKRGVLRVVYTDTLKDGMLAGPNLTTTRRMAEGSGLKVIASGGVSSLEDLRSLKQLEPYGVEGVIVGKALYEKKFSLEEALECG